MTFVKSFLMSSFQLGNVNSIIFFEDLLFHNNCFGYEIFNKYWFRWIFGNINDIKE